MFSASDPSSIDPSLDSRAATFENPGGARGAGGQAARGRKGAPSRRMTPGETVVLLDTEGPGTIRHIWFTIPPARPERMRAVTLEITYDGGPAPSVSVPILDFVGVTHGRPTEIDAELISVPEARGFNTWVPMPFERSIRMELTNHAATPTTLYYQVDYTLEPDRTSAPSHLHAAFRRSNPTTIGEDFVISAGLRGPGRFLGCVVGIRVLDEGMWYGEGEVKVYRDGDVDHPTICGTGLEDYVGSAWGLQRHGGLHAGAPLDLRPPREPGSPPAPPDFVGFYRFHRLDPIMFAESLRVTIQQIGFALFPEGAQEALDRYVARHPAAGGGWTSGRGVLAAGIFERVDDYCAVDFVYCREPQAVPRVDVDVAVADIGRLPYERADPMEAALGAMGGVAES